MTNEEAIEELKAIKSAYRNKAFGDSRLMRSEIEALDMAIQALEQDNCPYYVIDDDGHGLCTNHRYIPTMYYPQVDGITPTVVKAEQEPSGDLISRQAVLDILEKEGHKWGNDYRDWVDAVEEIKKLPHVNPQEPKWDMLLNWLNDMRFGIAPDETVTDIDELHCREAQTDILDEIMKWMKKQTPKSKCLLSQKYRDWLFIQEPKENDRTCHTCKHYTSGEQDGSCDSYICEGYSDWESDNCN